MLLFSYVHVSIHLRENHEWNHHVASSTFNYYKLILFIGNVGTLITGLSSDQNVFKNAFYSTRNFDIKIMFSHYR